MTTIESLEKRVAIIEERNTTVEVNKAWETSLTRRVVLMVLTYFAIALYLRAINISEPWLNAIIPTIGFFLSTLTLPYFKKLWQKYIYK